MTKAAAEPLPDLWDDAYAADLDEPGLLLYRSNLLGSDLRITNFGGGNTSAKIAMTDPLTQKPVTVLWVKGSGGDIGSMKRDGFSTLYLDKLESLKRLYRGLAHEDEMVALFNHCTFNLNPRATSIDTALHGFVPHPHVDHVHADAVIAIAACANAEELTRRSVRRRDRLPALAAAGLRPRPEARRDGDRASRICRRRARRPRPVHLGPDIEGGLPDHVAHHPAGRRLARGQRKAAGLRRSARRCCRAEKRRAVAAALMPLIRGKISRDERKVGHFTDAPEVLEFVNSHALDRLAPLGTSCPDHFLRTKIRPAGAALRSAKATMSMRSPIRSTRFLRPIATTIPPITSAASGRIRRPCATPMR